MVCHQGYGNIITHVSRMKIIQQPRGLKNLKLNFGNEYARLVIVLPELEIGGFEPPTSAMRAQRSPV